MVSKTIDKYQFKITIAVAVSIIIFLIMLSANFATWKSEMESTHKAFTVRQAQLADNIIAVQNDVNDLDKRQDDADIALTEIKTKLINIETLLVEIKQDIRNK